MKKRGAETSILKVRCFSALSNSTENGQQVLKHLLAVFFSQWNLGGGIVAKTVPPKGGTDPSWAQKILFKHPPICYNVWRSHRKARKGIRTLDNSDSGENEVLLTKCWCEQKNEKRGCRNGINSIAGVLTIDPSQVFVKAKTGEKLPPVGTSEAVEATVVCLLSR